MFCGKKNAAAKKPSAVKRPASSHAVWSSSRQIRGWEDRNVITAAVAPVSQEGRNAPAQARVHVANRNGESRLRGVRFCVQQRLQRWQLPGNLPGIYWPGRVTDRLFADNCISRDSASPPCTASASLTHCRRRITLRRCSRTPSGRPSLRQANASFPGSCPYRRPDS